MFFEAISAAQKSEEKHSRLVVQERGGNRNFFWKEIRMVENYNFLDTNLKLFEYIRMVLQWFLNDTEVYRLVPGAPREFRRLVFNQMTVSVDLQSSKVRRYPYMLTYQHTVCTYH